MIHVIYSANKFKCKDNFVWFLRIISYISSVYVSGGSGFARTAPVSVRVTPLKPHRFGEANANNLLYV